MCIRDSLKIEEHITHNSNLSLEIKNLQKTHQELIAIKSQLSAKNENLQTLLETQKEEISKMQEMAKIEFQNLANKILEEKTEKFTKLNQTQLKTMLEPLGEKIEIFKKRVNEVYENEARERFSLNSTITVSYTQLDVYKRHI